MKFKQRCVIGVFGASLILASMLITLTIYFFTSGIRINEYIHEKITNVDEAIPLQIMAVPELDRMEIATTAKSLQVKNRRQRKKISRRANFTYADSNHAAEVELSEKEYEELLTNKQLLKASAPSIRKESKSSANNEDAYSRYVRECINFNFPKEPVKNSFPDLVNVLQNEQPILKKYWKFFKRNRITIQDIHRINLQRNLTLSEHFHLAISDKDMYREDDKLIEDLLLQMSKTSIVHVEEKPGGTQLKLIVTFHDGSQALMKPMRFDRDKETLPNHFYFVDFERHNSEIAAFHLDRILGFRRCPPVVGRKLNVTTEIYSVADDELLKTFFISPAQNYCFHGRCSYYCDTGHAICGQPDDIEGSLAAFLPPDQLSGRKSWKNPWKRSYHKRRKAIWEKDSMYCEVVRQQPLYNNTKRLADLIDMHILDFLMGNMDRHHYETFKLFGNDSFILHLDHGRGFGRPQHDEISILAPLYQCCFINSATLERLLQLHLNPMKLSTLMRCSLYADPVNPVLNEANLKALDRRLEIVLEFVRNCFQNKRRRQILFHGKF